MAVGRHLPACLRFAGAAGHAADAAGAEQIARSRQPPDMRVLVLCPPEARAQQVAQAIRLVPLHQGVLRVANVVGSTPFQAENNCGAARCVPRGRHAGPSARPQPQWIGLDCVQTLVVDEADRMLDLGFSRIWKPSTSPQLAATAR